MVPAPPRGTAPGRPLSQVTLSQVSKRWGEAAAVDAVGFTAPEGQLVALLGPSGCGKSTTLRLVAGLDRPDGGTIRIGARDVTALPPALRGVSMVFQSYALFPHLTVAQNILFGLEVRRVPKAERAARLARTAGLLGLTPLLDRRPSQLSGGQQQRVALGRAIVAEKPVCLMDEPLSNLDAQLRVEMRREIRALQRRLGLTMLYVTHDQVEAMTMADRVVLMRGGRIEQDATPAELYRRPATAFAARFVGTPPMNVIAARHLAGAVANPPAGRDPASLLVGLRPESIRLASEGEGEGRGVLADVAAVEYLGADTLVDARVGAEPFTVRLPGEAATRPGERLRLGFAPGDAHWFDAETGARVTGT